MYLKACNNIKTIVSEHFWSRNSFLRGCGGRSILGIFVFAFICSLGFVFSLSTGFGIFFAEKLRNLWCRLFFWFGPVSLRGWGCYGLAIIIEKRNERNAYTLPFHRNAVRIQKFFTRSPTKSNDVRISKYRVDCLLKPIYRVRICITIKN